MPYLVAVHTVEIVLLYLLLFEILAIKTLIG